jgi:hypothetical protein
VHGPDRGAQRSKAYLYPSGLVAPVACEDVPLRWRRMFALATYLYARAGEINALTWRVAPIYSLGESGEAMKSMVL